MPPKSAAPKKSPASKSKAATKSKAKSPAKAKGKAAGSKKVASKGKAKASPAKGKGKASKDAGKPEKRTRKKKDPNAPKRGMSAFMFYSNDVRATVKAERPDLTFLNIASEIGARWKQLNDKQKKKYEAMALKDKQRYENEKEGYTPDPAFLKQGKKKKDPNAPKRALSAYLYFCNDNRASCQKKNPNAKITEIASLLAVQWKACPDKKRAIYNKQAEDDKARYLAEMEAYNREN